MSDPVADHYEGYYADKLWSLLPVMYRAEDGTSEDVNGPLRELVERFGAQAAVLRRSIDRLWEDQSIESCDDWVIAYIGDLLATNLVASLDARGQRVDVAKTIYYRRRKGTVPLLEELSANITGWDARVVEFFRRLGRSRHGLDPAFGWPIEVADPSGKPTLLAVEGLVGTRTRTPAGGFADLRNVYGAQQANTAFDELSHTADVRLGRGATGWHNIPHLGVFLWRLESVGVLGSTPVRDAACPNQITFDPTGRDIPLFAVGNRSYGNAWVSPSEQNLPTRISAELLRTATSDLYGWEKALALFLNDPFPEDLFAIGTVTADPRGAAHAHYIDPTRGRVHLAPATDPTTVVVGYHYGFPSTIGAGGFDRRLPGKQVRALLPVQPVKGGGASFAAAPGSGTVRLLDSLTYSSVPSTITVDPGAQLVIAAENKQRPVLRLAPGSTWTFVGQVNADGRASELVLDGLWLCGCDVVLRGVFEKVTLRTCTIDPGNSPDGVAVPNAADGTPLVAGHLLLEGSIRQLVIERSIVGPIGMDSDPKKAEVETVLISDSIIQAVIGTEHAIDLRTGMTDVASTTFFGQSRFHRLEASNVIFDDIAVVLDAQHGCTRFSAYAKGSQLPRPYECVEIAPAQELFVSRAFGNPSFAQLLESVDDTISEGADNGSEMGAYCRENVPIKERSLLVKFQEYMPVGMTPVLIYVT